MPSLRRQRRSLLFLGTLGLVAGLGVYDLFFEPGYTYGTLLLSPLDWLFIVANLVVLFYAVVPLVDHPGRTADVWASFRTRPGAVLGAGWLAAVYLLGTVGFLLAPDLSLAFQYQNQPPVFGSIATEHVSNCVGPVVDGRCHGSWRYPLGTDLNGYGMGLLVLNGLHVSVYVAVISLAFIVPLALVVGTVAGYLGGWVDVLSMRGVEVQDAVPPLVVYLLVIFITGESLLVILLLFGLFGWGGAARVVRSEARRLSDVEFVRATRALGGDRWHVLRVHVVPSIAAVAVPTATQQIPVLLLTEAGVAFLGLEAFDLQSFGNIIARGTTQGQVPMLAKWGVSGIAVAALAGTVLAFKLVGDALVEALDPRN